MTLSIAEIENLAKEMDNESKAIKKEIFKMCWYMRGGLTVNEAYQIDYSDRQIISEIIKDNLEVTKETNLPFF